MAKLRTTDRAIVADVKGSTSIAQELTSDRNSIARAIRGLSAGGETAVYDAVYVILRELERERRTAAQVRRQALVLLTDGIDTRSRLAFEDVLDVARRGDVSIYVVALKSAVAQTPRSELPGAMLRSDYALNTFTRESGGRLFVPKTAPDLPGIYTAIAEELFSQYRPRIYAAAGGRGRRLQTRRGQTATADECPGAHTNRLHRVEHESRDGALSASHHKWRQTCSTESLVRRALTFSSSPACYRVLRLPAHRGPTAV